MGDAGACRGNPLVEEKRNRSVKLRRGSSESVTRSQVTQAIVVHC
jgi:hypothetical protein